MTQPSKKVLKFDESTITDQKRLVRGEHWLLARRLLRARDEKHHGRWRIITMAGGAPDGEFKAIRELMRNAYILAVDVDPLCLERAIDAGADDVLEVDVLAFERMASTFIGRYEKPGCYQVPPALQNRAKFDVINLDLCGSVSADLRRCVSLYLRQLITPRGVLMVTFSYGRDVAEMFMGLGRDWQISRANGPHETYSLPIEVSENLAGRIMYLGQQRYLRSIMNYKGADMPMCSLLYQIKDATTPISFVKLGRGDYELAVSYPDAANLYDCPQQRIDSLRRKFAAIKASFTRADTTKQRQTSLLADADAV